RVLFRSVFILALVILVFLVFVFFVLSFLIVLFVLVLFIFLVLIFFVLVFLLLLLQFIFGHGQVITGLIIGRVIAQCILIGAHGLAVLLLLHKCISQIVKSLVLQGFGFGIFGRVEQVLHRLNG